VLEYIGHRGAVTAVAVNVERGLAVTGGADGIARTWDLASGMPSAFGEPEAAPISVVAIAADARLVASAAGPRVRVANPADGTTVLARSVGGAVTALAFAPDGASLAIGDATGTLTIAPLANPGRAITAQAMGAVTALAFASAGAQLAVGVAAGTVRLLRATDGSSIGIARTLTQAIRWLDFNADGSALLLATVDWLHALRTDSTLEPLASRFAPRPLDALALAAGNNLELRYADVGADGAATVTPFDLAAPPPAAAGTTARDWPVALGVRLDDRGEPAPFDP
jgi:hypothetical protein